jgi:hypothetical protein
MRGSRESALMLQIQVAYFLKHWAEIKKSDTMMQIWQQIRHGKHVGFEEGGSRNRSCLVGPRERHAEWTVWPLIVGQLDFKPS